jgi:hypothetical protein
MVDPAAAAAAVVWCEGEGGHSTLQLRVSELTCP